ncbi:hypothetical protein DUI87_06414 [Hirundo rustica rustica]|uniref:Uncharacterized protein n=1 Tax=Hirundo rustica rustica TaxID=333673 RepID=A0A3M0KT56_HIRRU|nr:hypothetical protein DUI87_06414 [Hirundo rustica rustica]
MASKSQNCWKVKGVDPSEFSTSATQLECCALYWTLQYKTHGPNVDDQGFDVSDTKVKCEKAGTLHPGANTAQGDFTNGYKYLIWQRKKLEPGSSLECPVKGQEVMGTN